MQVEANETRTLSANSVRALRYVEVHGPVPLHHRCVIGSAVFDWLTQNHYLTYDKERKVFTLAADGQEYLNNL